MSDYFAFTWQGRDYSVNIGEVTAAEWRAVKQHTGIKAGEFLSAIGNAAELDGDAIMALLWLGKKHAGDPNPPFEDDLPIFDFLVAMAESKTKLDAVAAANEAADVGPKA